VGYFLSAPSGGKQADWRRQKKRIKGKGFLRTDLNRTPETLHIDALQPSAYSRASTMNTLQLDSQSANGSNRLGGLELWRA
jgi:hypothetical protein